MTAPKIEFTRQLLQRLWEDYASRVSYARVYQQMLEELSAVLVNDHIAFRTLAVTVNGHDLGIPLVKRIWEALGYVERGAFEFPDTHLFARFVKHPEPDFPKIFISQLLVDELPTPVAQMIRDSVAFFHPVLGPSELQALENLDRGGISGELLERTVAFFKTLPWEPPFEEVVLRVNEVSQYGAWVLLHGCNVNHFTGYVNRHHVEPIADIEGLVAELKKRGVPMKAEIEGERGSKLRQTATHAVTVPVKVRAADGTSIEIPWTYAYMEFAQRGYVEEDGKQVLFEGFLGPQARQLFEMTRVK